MTMQHNAGYSAARQLNNEVIKQAADFDECWEYLREA
jgi:hypothetical protein